MSSEIHIDSEVLTAVSDGFSAAMENFIETDFQYFQYLRNRQRYYVGGRSEEVKTVNPATKFFEKKPKAKEGGRRPNGRPFNIPIGVPSRVPFDIPSIAIPERKPVTVDDPANDIKDFIRQPQPEDVNVGVPETQPQPVTPDVTTPLPGEINNEVEIPNFVVPEKKTEDVYQGPNLGDRILEGIGTNLQNALGFSLAAGLVGFELIKTLGRGLLPGYAKGGIVRTPTKALIGEAGPEVVIPMGLFGQVIESVYREGASALISSSMGFLAKLPSSTAKATVLAEANRLKGIFGISKMEVPEGDLGLKSPLAPIKVGGSGNAAVFVGAPKQEQGGGGGGGLPRFIRKALAKAFKKGWKALRKTPVGKFIRRGRIAAKKARKAIGKTISKVGSKVGRKGAAKAAQKGGLKLAGKIGAKGLGALPLVGNVFDLAFAAKRFADGDAVGGLLSLGSAIPVLGWGVAALDVARTTGAFDGGPFGRKSKDQKKVDATKFASNTKTEIQTPDPTRGGSIILNPSTMKAWSRAVAAAAKDGIDLTQAVTSSYRSPADQQALIDRAAAGDPNVMTPAPVGKSPHGQGWAIDINFYSPANEWMRNNGGKYGFKWQGENDPVHFDFWNNEPNDKWLQPGNRDWIPNATDPQDKSSSSLVTNELMAKAPDISGGREILNDTPVTQGGKMFGETGEVVRLPVPIPIPKAIPIMVGGVNSDDGRSHLIIDVFGKGTKTSREVVSV